MSTMEEVLDRVRKALGRPQTGSVVTPLPPLDLAGVMPPLAPEDYQAKFEQEWEKVAGVAYCVASMNELESVFQKILMLAESQAVALSGNPILAELHIAERLAALNKFVTSWGEGSGVAGTHSLADFTKASFRCRSRHHGRRFRTGGKRHAGVEQRHGKGPGGLARATHPCRPLPAEPTCRLAR